jgi:hypothetical protein
MALGPGKYDELATFVRAYAEARGVIVMVFGGLHGSGFSVQTVDRQLAALLPELLREMADEIEADTKQGEV